LYAFVVFLYVERAPSIRRSFIKHDDN
jgi:hypothetical protein